MDEAIIAIVDWLGYLNENIGLLASYLGIIAFVPIALIFYEVWFGRRRRHKEWFDLARTRRGAAPVILIIDLLPTRQIDTPVEAFRQTIAELADIPQDKIFRISHAELGVTGAELSADVMTAFEQRLTQVVADIYKAAPDVIHYFHSGPLPTVAMVAAVLANGPTVNMYHFRQGGYESWGPIKHALR